MAQYSFDTKGVTAKDHQRAALHDFRGVDCANPIYAVDTKRATAMRNLISIDGANHKRPGWKQVAKFVDASGEDMVVFGWFRFVLNGNEHRVVYAANSNTKTWYRLSDGAYTPISATGVDASRFKARPAYMVMGENRVYFYGFGDILVCIDVDGELILRNVVDDEDTTVPVTTMGIDCIETEYSTADDDSTPVIAKVERRTNRDVNLLTRYRKNALVGSTQCDSEHVRSYQLDGKDIDFNASVRVDVALYDSDSETVTQHQLVATSGSSRAIRRARNGDNLKTGESGVYSTSNIYWDTSVTDAGTLYFLDNGVVLSSSSAQASFKIYIDWSNSNHNSGSVKIKYVSSGEQVFDQAIATVSRTNWLYRYTILWKTSSLPDWLTYNSQDHKLVADLSHQSLSGSVDDIIVGTAASGEKAIFLPCGQWLASYLKEGNTTWGAMDYEAGVVSFYHDITPVVAGSNNITVTFAVECKETEEVRTARFGALFGAKGATNVLVLGGIENAVNVDYMSQAEDYTYFPSGRRTKVGTANSAIVGYLRQSDNALAVIKEDVGHEPTLYLRTGEPVDLQYYEDEQQFIVKDASFSDSGKYISKGAVCESGFGMLDGDALFIAKDGVYGIVIGEDSVVAESRIARLRSRFISRLLAKHNLSQATSIVYKDRFYLAIDGAVYVADSRYRFKDKADVAETYNYEWWVWDNCPVKRFYAVDDALYFATNDGRLCVFDNEYTDRLYVDYATVGADALAKECVSIVMQNAPFANEVMKIGIASSVLGEDTPTSINVSVKDSNLYIYFLYSKTGQESELIALRALWGSPSHVVLSTSAGPTAIGEDCVMVDVEYTDGGMPVFKQDGASYTFGGTKHYIYVPIAGIELRLGRKGISDGNVYYRFNKPILGDGNVYWAEESDLRYLGGDDPAYISLRVWETNNVVAEWYTPALDMGAPDWVKELSRLTISTQSVVEGAIQFGYETRGEASLSSLDSDGINAFDFSNLNFGNFTFDTGFSSAFSRRVKSPFNFIVLRFVSDNPFDCCVDEMTIEYKLKHRNKGVF